MSIINRKGIVKVSKSLIQGEDGIRALMSLMSKFAPTIIEETLTQRIYHGYSEEFKEVKEGDLIPVYEAILEYSNNYDKDFKWDVNFKEI